MRAGIAYALAEAMDEGHCGLPTEELIPLGCSLLEVPADLVETALGLYPMLARNLLYTGVTRGKRLVVLVGQRKALAIAVKGEQTRRRWSKLCEWLAD